MYWSGNTGIPIFFLCRCVKKKKLMSESGKIKKGLEICFHIISPGQLVFRSVLVGVCGGYLCVCVCEWWTKRTCFERPSSSKPFPILVVSGQLLFLFLVVRVHFIINIQVSYNPLTSLGLKTPSE